MNDTRIICPTCGQDMNESPRNSKYGDCQQCGQGLRKPVPATASEQECLNCGKPVGNSVFTYCDNCWSKPDSASTGKDLADELIEHFDKLPFDYDRMRFKLWMRKKLAATPSSGGEKWTVVSYGKSFVAIQVTREDKPSSLIGTWTLDERDVPERLVNIHNAALEAK